jgi:hypothetical protein
MQASYAAQLAPLLLVLLLVQPSIAHHQQRSQGAPRSTTAAGTEPLISNRTNGHSRRLLLEPGIQMEGVPPIPPAAYPNQTLEQVLSALVAGKAPGHHTPQVICQVRYFLLIVHV